MKRALLFAATLAVAFPAFMSMARAHAVCGNRVFPATLTMDDPGVGDELSLPTIQYEPTAEVAGGGRTISYGYEWDKTITEHFGFSISSDYVTQHNAGISTRGFDNVTAGLKDEFYCDNEHELMASVGVFHVFGGTGSSKIVSTTTTVGSTAPTLFFGKGLGDLPIGYLRPLAITGEVGYAISDTQRVQPNEWDYALSLQYSIPYLQQHVKDLGLPGFLGHLTPLIEVALSRPAGLATTGTISPGILYDADTWQFGVEANIPANNATRQSQGVGFIAQFHLFLDDIFPASLGKPIF